MNEVDTAKAAPARRSFGGAMFLLVIAFVAGLAAMGWLLTRWEAAQIWLLGERQPVAAVSAPVTKVAPTPQPAPSPLTAIPASPDATARLAAVESRLAQLETDRASSGMSSVRAEGLLVTFAARRALDRGVGLGYVEGLLSQQFGASQPRAVATIIALARQPVTLDQLQVGLDKIAPELTGAGGSEGWWTRFRSGIASLIVVRKSGVASPDPKMRIARAQDMLDAGRVDVALAEVSRMTTSAKASGWMGEARRYVEAHRALDVLEAAAITAQPGAVAAPRPASGPAPTPAPAPIQDGSEI